ncbi:hypothetical protein [Bradyrhizobium murdochi]|uniref:hypothetical protein n=1 Tax=Bradyrhizobium murdochi TaxID=1038859 RepID=UPI0012EB2631|nr:hypothetical protein [Bradyrhizobium murdochi]
MVVPWLGIGILPEVPPHIGKKETTGLKKSSAGGSHHYYGGPKSQVPHHIGPKKD